MRFTGYFPSALLALHDPESRLQDGLKFQTGTNKTVSADIVLNPGLWHAYDPPYMCDQILIKFKYRKLEEVTSQLNSLQEALKTRSDPQYLHIRPDETRSSRTVTPEAGVGVLKPPSITVGVSHAVDVSFFGIEDSVNSALAIGDQTLGMHRLSTKLYFRLVNPF